MLQWSHTYMLNGECFNFFSLVTDGFCLSTSKCTRLTHIREK